MRHTEKDQPAQWWRPHNHEDRRWFLQQRQIITREIRNYFYNQLFTEVEATCLQFSPGNETHISAFQTQLTDPSGRQHAFYLHSSPEFMCKKLLAAGETKLFSLAKVFRNRERGPLHHPEFTMLEWYRVEPFAKLYEDVISLISIAARSSGCMQLMWRDQQADPFLPPAFISVEQAFRTYADIDLLPLLGDQQGFARAAAAQGIRLSPDDNWSDIFSKIMTTLIEPHLGVGRLTFLTDYPASEAALARLNPQDTRFAQRFEVYACGVELANAFAELSDANEQRQRFEQQMHERQRIYGEHYPIDEDFLDALSFMPESSGIALGFDRLIMLVTHAQRIEQVIWAPVRDAND
jgi:lysyl-tRNA synthetase class 2